jgi:valyl-tRNA synthetase
MNPKQADSIIKKTKKEFAEGIKPYGTDALRFTFASLASPGRDIKFDLQRCEGYRNFCNKLWNAARFVLMNCEEQDNGFEECTDGYLEFSQADRWIVSELQITLDKIHKAYEEYRFDLLSQEIYRFIWDEYCDWYLELAKIQIQNGTEAQQRATRRTLITSLELILRVSHPLIPFITEEIWQTVAPLAKINAPSIMLQKYPTAQLNKIDKDAISWMALLKEMVESCRSLRGEMNISPAQKIPLVVEGDEKIFNTYKDYIKGLAKLSEVEVVKKIPDQDAPVAIINNFKLMLNIEVDKEAELLRLTKELSQLDIQITKAHGKLSNKSFTSKAPSEVIEQEEERLKSFSLLREKLQSQYEKLNS